MVYRFSIKILKCVLIVTLLFVLSYQIIQKLEVQNEDISTWDEIPKEKIQELLKTANLENSKRKSKLRKICKKYNLGLFKLSPSKTPAFKVPPAPQYEVFFFDLERKLAFCPIYKAGSTSWLHNFALLTGLTEEALTNSKTHISELVKKIYPPLESEDAQKALRHSLTFLFVRHPFERLLSAYRDKLENVAVRGIDGTKHFYSSYGSKIVNKYRAGGNGTNIRGVLRPGQYLWNENKEPVGIEPSFKEFVKHLIDADLTRADDHWIPYYLFCTPCNVKYDVVGKVESMLQDQIYIIHMANLQQRIRPRWKHKTNPFSDSQSAISGLAKIYFSQLNSDELAQLYKKYRLDFQLFGYSPKEYYKYVTNN